MEIIKLMKLKKLINQLPEYIKDEILYFIIVNPNNINFIVPTNIYLSNYNEKYKISEIKKNNNYLSRIEKNNNKYRYYITIITYNKTCGQCGRNNCHSRACRSDYEIEYTYKSKYIGKNINKALLYFI